jgi:hypothetical protein
MGAVYTADAFFGAFVDRNTQLGKKLDRYVDKAGGTPAETGTPGVEICQVGSTWSGKIWMVVRAEGSGHNFDREDEIVEPQALTEDPAWRPALLTFFHSIKLKEPPPIGWYFAGSVS